MAIETKQAQGIDLAVENLRRVRNRARDRERERCATVKFAVDPALAGATVEEAGHPLPDSGVKV